MSSRLPTVRFGGSGSLRLELRPETVAGWHRGPEPLPDVSTETMAALDHPLEVPPLVEAVVPGDRVVLVSAGRFPALEPIGLSIWNRLCTREVDAAQSLWLEGFEPDFASDTRTRAQTPPAGIQGLTRKTHTPSETEPLSYLATSAAGERVYLARELVEADFVLPIAMAGFDPLVGYRHAPAVLYPGCSDAAAQQKLTAQGHTELEPDDDRPLRQLQDEVAWLLGVQFVIEAIPSSDPRTPSAVFGGQLDAVARRTRSFLNEHWTCRPERRMETVVVAVPTTEPLNTWNEIAAALAAAQRLVIRGGRIILLCQVSPQLPEAIDLLRQTGNPRDALRLVRDQAPLGYKAASLLASAAHHARISCLSGLPGDVMEELFLTPIDHPQEVQRILEMESEIYLLYHGQHTHVKLAT